MRLSAKGLLLKYGITTLVDLAIGGAYFFSRIPASQFSLVSDADKARVLCDAFFLPGILTLFIGLLMWLASDGAMDGGGYLFAYVKHAVIPGRRGSFESYGVYLARKRENRKKGGTGFLCIVGLVFILVSCLFLAQFNGLHP